MKDKLKLSQIGVLAENKIPDTTQEGIENEITFLGKNHT